MADINFLIEKQGLRRLFKRVMALILIGLEALILFHFKDSSSTFVYTNHMPFAEFMRQYGGIQFLFASYVQKIVFVVLSSYPVLLVILLAKAGKKFAKEITLREFDLSIHTLLINIIFFGVLLLFFVNIHNPTTLISDPLGIEAIFYTAIPLAWIFYLYSVLDFLFPIQILKKLLNNNGYLAIAVFILTALSTNPAVNPIHLEGILKMYSGILLEPTVIVASNIAHAFGFPTHVFSYPGASFPDFGTERFHTGITPDCSGYEGITLIVILLAGYCYSRRSTLKLPRSFLVIPFAVIGMFFLNAIRIVILIAIGHFYSPDLAFNGFHTVGGWLNLLIVLILSLWALNRFQFFLIEAKPITPVIRSVGYSSLLFPLMSLITS